MEIASFDERVLPRSTAETLHRATMTTPVVERNDHYCKNHLKNERSWRPASGFASKHQVELETKCLYRERLMQRARKIQQMQDDTKKRHSGLSKGSKASKHVLLEENEWRTTVSYGRRKRTDQKQHGSSSILLTLPSDSRAVDLNQSSCTSLMSVAVTARRSLGQDEIEAGDVMRRKRRHHVKKRQQKTPLQQPKGKIDMIDGVPHPSLLGEVMFVRRSSLQRLVDELHVDDAVAVRHGRQSKGNVQLNLALGSFRPFDYGMRKAKSTSCVTTTHQGSAKAYYRNETSALSPRRHSHHADNRTNRRSFSRSDTPQSPRAESDSHGSPCMQKCGDKRDFFFRNLAYELRNQLQVDEVAEFSVTDSEMAAKISQAVLDLFAPLKDETTSESGSEDHEDGSMITKERKKYPIVVTDGTACIGGNVLSFCDYFMHVNAIENDSTRVQMLQHNLQVLKNTNVTCIHANYLDVMLKLKQDIVFLDPPWGGPEYKDLNKVDLFLGDVPLHEICTRLQSCTKCIVLKVPSNFDDVKFSRQVPGNVMIRRDLKKMHIVFLDFRVETT